MPYGAQVRHDNVPLRTSRRVLVVVLLVLVQVGVRVLTINYL